MKICGACQRTAQHTLHGLQLEGSNEKRLHRAQKDFTGENIKRRAQDVVKGICKNYLNLLPDNLINLGSGKGFWDAVVAFIKRNYFAVHVSKHSKF